MILRLGKLAMKEASMEESVGVLKKCVGNCTRKTRVPYWQEKCSTCGGALLLVEIDEQLVRELKSRDLDPDTHH
jgi:hypothetical protein